jgi:hypothetical protein
MAALNHGGARAGAGRKPKVDRKVKRSVSLSSVADALVLANMRPGETYSQVLDRMICAGAQQQEPTVAEHTPIEVVVTALSAERQPVATIYRQLGWSRRKFEQVVQAQRQRLAEAGIRLHVATKDAASGRREQYITVDGVRYSAMSRDQTTCLEAAKNPLDDIDR